MVKEKLEKGETVDKKQVKQSEQEDQKQKQIE